MGGFRRDTLEFAGRARELAVLAVHGRELPRGLAVQLMVRPVRPETFEYRGRRRPVLQPDERRGGVVLRRRPYLRRRRRLSDPQEIVGRRTVILRGVRLLALLVDCR